MPKRVDCHQRWRYCGRTLRITIFICNAIAWLVGMMCLIGGMLVGFYTKSLMLVGMGLIDFWLATPVTIFMYYGILLLITSGAGCFTGSGGRWWWSASYCVLIILLGIFDWFAGIHVFFSTTSLMDFLKSIYASMNNYGVEGKTFGIFPVPVTAYWEHIQSQGHCCGFYNWEDWKNTTIGKKRSLPDSCCNERYGHRSCGEDLLHHPDKKTNFKRTEHLLTDVIHTKSCLSGYPRYFIEFFHEASIMGPCLTAILLFCFILSLVLFIMVVLRRYRPGQRRPRPKDPEQEDNRKDQPFHPRDSYPSKPLKNMNPYPDDRKRSGIFRSKPKEVEGPVRVRGKGEWDKYKVAPVHRWEAHEEVLPPRTANTGPTRREQKVVRVQNPPPQRSRFMNLDNGPRQPPPGRRNSAFKEPPPANRMYYMPPNKVHPYRPGRV